MSRWFSGAARSTDESLQAGSAWVEGDLWRNAGTGRQTGAPGVSQPRAGDFDFSQTEIVRSIRTPRHTGVKQVRPVASVSAKRRGDRVAGIGRFMQVNRTIEGGRGSDYRVVQSPRHVSADYDLWKGPTSVVTFFLGG